MKIFIKEFNKMSNMKPIDHKLNISKERKRWTNINHKYKKYFTEKILPIFDKHFFISDVFVPIETSDPDTGDITSTEISYTGHIDLLAYIMGGYVYEYIFNADVKSNDAFFSATEDVDLQVIIPDIFSDGDFISINSNLILKSTFFQGIITNIIERLYYLDYTDLDSFDILDSLPEPNENEKDFVDKDKVRIVLVESYNEDDLTFQKIQLKICKNGIYEDIMDIMITMEKNIKKTEVEFIEKLCYDGISREIKYLPKSKLFSSEFDALIDRYSHTEVITKTRNHVGRMLFLLFIISSSDNEADKYAVKLICEYKLSNLVREKKMTLQDVAKIVICEYKGAIITIADLISPIKDYAISKHSDRFIKIFSK